MGVVAIWLPQPCGTQVSEMERHIDHLEAIAEMVEQIPTLMCRSTPDTTILWANRAYGSFYGAHPEALVGHRWIDRIASSEQIRVVEALASLTPQHPTLSVKRLSRRHDGVERMVEWTETAIFGPEGDIVEIRTLAYDTSDDLGAAVAAVAAANTDPLTGVSNRRALDEHIQTIAASRPDERHSIIVADLDGFKSINDTYGHAVGDVVLQEFARRLERVTRSTDMVVRMGGDEFVILLTRLSTAEGVDRIATRITRVFDDPVQIDDLALHVTASAGLATGMARDLSGSALQAADELMYEAKRAMRGSLLARLDGRRYVWTSAAAGPPHLGNVVDLARRELDTRGDRSACVTSQAPPGVNRALKESAVPKGIPHAGDNPRHGR